MNGIEKMTALILSEAEADREARLKDARTDAEALLAQYRGKADALLSVEDEKTAKEVDAILERASSSANQIERNKLLEAKGMLLDSVYEDVLERLCSDEYASTKAYFDMLKGIFRSVLADQLDAEKTAAENDRMDEFKPIERYSIRLNHRDKEAIGADLIIFANKESANVGKTVVLDDAAASIRGGFILVCGDIELNASLELYLQKVRSTTESEVYAILFA